MQSRFPAGIKHNTRLEMLAVTLIAGGCTAAPSLSLTLISNGAPVNQSHIEWQDDAKRRSISTI